MVCIENDCESWYKVFKGESGDILAILHVSSKGGGKVDEDFNHEIADEVNQLYRDYGIAKRVDTANKVEIHCPQISLPYREIDTRCASNTRCCQINP